MRVVGCCVGNVNNPAKRRVLVPMGPLLGLGRERGRRAGRLVDLRSFLAFPNRVRVEGAKVCILRHRCFPVRSVYIFGRKLFIARAPFLRLRL